MKLDDPYIEVPESRIEQFCYRHTVAIIVFCLLALIGLGWMLV